jgi:hypothetical protein
LIGLSAGTMISVLSAHDGERHKTRAVDRDRIGAGVESRDVQTAGAHRLDLGGIGLHREEHHLFPGRLRQVFDKAVPYLGVNGRVLDRRISEDQSRWVDPKFWIGRRIGDEIAVAIAIGLVEVAARTVLGVSESDQSGAENQCREKCRDGFAMPRHGLPLRSQCQKPNGDPDRSVIPGSLAMSLSGCQSNAGLRPPGHGWRLAVAR